MEDLERKKKTNMKLRYCNLNKKKIKFNKKLKKNKKKLKN